ncbi:Bleomycin resistance protein [Paraburkholderia tropica]
MRIAHVALWTRDIIAASSFWQQYFNAEIGPMYRSNRRPGFESCFVQLPNGDVQIELMTGPWPESRHSDECIGWDHIAVAVGSAEAVDALAERCRIDGLLVSAPRKTGDGFYEAVVSAPDGTRVEITT